MPPRAPLHAILFAGLLAVVAPAARAAADPRPNILFCFADDMGRYASAYAGIDKDPGLNAAIRTPNIDRVAREGALFRNAFVGAPSCTPCRSGLLSGRYFFQTGRGAILHNATWDPAIPSFPLLLRDAGYHIGKMYKVWSPGTPADAPFGGQAHAFEKAGRDFNDFSENATRLVREGVPREEAKRRMLDQVGANFDAFLAARGKGRPFLFWFGPTNVHRKWEHGSGTALWDINPDDLKGRLPPFLPDVPVVREDIAGYLGEIQAFDAAVGLLVARLEAAGELSNTVVVVSGDHGMPGMPSGKCNLHDFGTRVTLAARGPGIHPGRVVDAPVLVNELARTFCQLGGVKPPADMMGHGLADLWGDGPALPRHFAVTGRERHVSQTRAGLLPYPSRAVHDGRWLYIRNFKPDRWPLGDPPADGKWPSAEEVSRETYAVFADMDASPTKAWMVEHRDDPGVKPLFEKAFGLRPAEELYDTEADPHQMRNLAADPGHASRRNDLQAALFNILVNAGDPRVQDPSDTFDKPPYAGEGTQPGGGKGAGKGAGKPAKR